MTKIESLIGYDNTVLLFKIIVPHIPVFYYASCTASMKNHPVDKRG